jgi:hypothetical protein
MGFLRAKKVADFAMAAAQRGGSFETSCTRDQVFTWLKATRVQVAGETENELVVNPVFTNGNVGGEAICLKTMPGTVKAQRVIIDVRLGAKPGILNLNALSPLTKMMQEVSAVDPKWKQV